MALDRKSCLLFDFDLPSPHDRLFLSTTHEDIDVFGVTYIGGGSILGRGELESGSDGGGQRLELELHLGMPNPDGLGATIPDEVSAILGQLTQIGVDLLNRGVVMSVADFDDRDRIVRVAPLFVGGIIESPVLNDSVFSITLGTTITLSREIPYATYGYEQQVFDHADPVYLLKRLQVLSPSDQGLTW